MYACVWAYLCSLWCFRLHVDMRGCALCCHHSPSFLTAIDALFINSNSIPLLSIYTLSALPFHPFQFIYLRMSTHDDCLNVPNLGMVVPDSCCISLRVQQFMFFSNTGPQSKFCSYHAASECHPLHTILLAGLTVHAEQL